MTSLKCSFCSATFDAPVPDFIDVTAEDTSGRERVTSGEAFLFTCPSCGKRTLACGQFIYKDEELKLLVILSQMPLISDGLEGYTCRLVSDVGSLIEKVKIAEAGLDDIAIELCKAVTAMDMKRDLDFKFLRTDGPDADIVFAYPDDGKMMMLAIGHNVYAECAGIVSRNHSIQDKSKGLVRVDKAWMDQFIA